MRLFRLGDPPKEAYDEVYYAPTAEAIALHDPAAYNPNIKNRTGYPYEWTHPPLGKVLMAVGVELFGPNPFGWRFSSAIFGTGVVFLASLIALSLFGSAQIALVTALLLSVDGLLFVQSRTCMIDIHVVFFILSAVFFYVRWLERPERLVPLLGLGMSLGCAAATKWNAVFLVLLIGPHLVYRWLIAGTLPFRNWAAWFFTLLVLVPIAIYFISFSDFFAMGNDLERFTALHQQMWSYHSGLKATHAYASAIWEWFTDTRPVWMHVAYMDKKTSVVYNIGNHVVFYSGLVAVLYSIRKLWNRWDAPLGFALGCYLALFVPWTFSPRIKFFHHYGPSVPFMCIMLAYMLHMTTRTDVNGPRVKKSYVLPTLLTAAIGWFVVLYPFMTALPVRKAFLDLFNVIIANPLG